MEIIDFHNHFYPPVYLEALQNGTSNINITFDEDKNPLLHYPGDYNIIVPGHRDIDFRAEVLNKTGVDKQILTFTTPGTHIESPERSVELARLVNESFSAIVHDRRDRFSALATLPMNDPEACVGELKRAFEELGFRGVMLFSNINGVALSDKCFWPLYEEASRLEAVFYIHPSFPVGVVEKFPGIRWVLGHLGGAIPYLAERLDRGFYAFKECREHISQPPGEYLKKFYYDSVNFDLNALQLAVDFAGADHIVAGSDYPHQIGSLQQMVSSIEGLKISPQEKAAILGGNAAGLLDL